MDLERLDHVPAMAAVMTPFPWSVGPDEPLARATDLMAEHGFRHVPVHDGHSLVGVVIERDAKALATVHAGEARPLRVRDALSAIPCVVEVSEPLDRVALMMASEHVEFALVTKHGRLAGIFTATDACRVLGRVLRGLFPGPQDDRVA